MPKPTRRPLRPAATFLLFAGMAGCGSSPEEPTDTAALTNCETPGSADFVRPFSVDAEQYPFESCAFETDYGLLHYIDEGPRDAQHTVVMVHGNPTWSFLYRNIAKALVDDGHRVVVPDHLGMGMSDIPSTADFDYRPRSHSAHLEDLVDALDLQNVTVVSQDWGGPIGLGMATRQADRIRSLLIMNTWAWSIDPDEPGTDHQVVDWYDQASQTEQALPGWFCQFAFPGQSEIMAAEVDPTGGAVFEAVLDAYLSPHIDPDTGAYVTGEPCAPMQILAESILDDDAYQAEVEAGMTALAGKPYALLTGQSDILFGALRCDQDAESPCPGASTCACVEEVLPSRTAPDCATASADFHVCVQPDGSLIEPNADRFVALLGSGSLVHRVSIPEADHMVQEDAPDAVIEALRSLLATD
jgi:haloalkane dehalogenase